MTKDKSMIGRIISKKDRLRIRLNDTLSPKGEINGTPDGEKRSTRQWVTHPARKNIATSTTKNCGRKIRTAKPIK
jgi:hypothetical protein